MAGAQQRREAQIMVNYLFAMELNINAYAIVEANNEEEAKKKGADLRFDCNLSPADNYGKVVPVVPFYHGDVDAEVVNVELYEYASNIPSLFEEERFRRSLRKKDQEIDELEQEQRTLMNGSQYLEAQQEVAVYEVTYSTKTASKNELSYSDIVLVEAETCEELTTKVVDLICRLGTPGSYYVDSIGGNPYESRSKKRITKKVIKDLDNRVSIINALILRHDQEL